MSEEEEARTLLGARVTVVRRLHSDHYLGSFDVICVDHEDGTLEFDESEAVALIGQLIGQVNANRRRRKLEVLNATAGRQRDECDRAWLNGLPCPLRHNCRYPVS